MPDRSPLLIQVVPRLTPGRCGVSDHAMVLVEGLKKHCGIDSALVVLNSIAPGEWPFPVVCCEPSKLLGSCLQLTGGQPGAILVHLSGYGYSADGAPTLLAEALEAVKASGRFRIAVYVHETFASGPPWKSAFWHSRRQQRAIRKVIAQAGLVATSIQYFAEWLEPEVRKQGSAPVHLMPVISTAGEAADPIPFVQRNPSLVVFGLAGTRQAAYKQMAAAGNLLATLGIQEILDIGPECGHPAEVNGIRVKPMGLMSAEELPAVFAQAQFGFVTHVWFCLGKSSVFAAYCAQGTIPVMAGTFPQEADGLREGVHVVTPRTVEAVRQSGWETCSRAAWNWYMGHRAQVHVERYAKWMGERQ